MDLAFRVVERYFGREVAEETAYKIEYQAQGWTNPDSNLVYTQPPRFTANKSLCPVCGMDIEPTITSVDKGKTYLFCNRNHKEAFDKDPPGLSAQLRVDSFAAAAVAPDAEYEGWYRN